MTKKCNHRIHQLLCVLLVTNVGLGCLRISVDGFPLALISTPLTSRPSVSIPYYKDLSCLQTQKPIKTWPYTDTLPSWHFTKAFMATGSSDSKGTTRKKRKSNKTKYLESLSPLVARTATINIKPIVKNWVDVTFQKKPFNQALELIFNDFEAKPDKVVKLLAIDVFEALLTDLLERCNSYSLWHMFAEGCINLRSALKAKELLYDLHDHGQVLYVFGNDAKVLAEELINPKTPGMYVTDLSQLLSNNGNNAIETIVQKWFDDSFGTKPLNQTLGLLFNDIEANPSDSLKLISDDVLKALLADLLDQCTTDSLCKMFAERCVNLGSVLKIKRLLNDFCDHYYLLNKFASNAKAKEQEIMKEQSARRVFMIDFRMDSHMHSRFDLDRISNRIDDLFQWYRDDYYRRRYIAPYFSMIQSSGTGKTRLLKQLKDEINKSNDTYCELYTCKEQRSKIHKQFSIQEMQSLQSFGEFNIHRTWNYLNRLLPEDKTKAKVVLLFDEAQTLLEDDAIYFRYIHWWLREKADERGVERTQQVVAVFAGTTTRLAVSYREAPMERYSSRNPTKKFWNLDGYNECYKPFIDLTTIGSVRFVVGRDVSHRSEYERAALYGRPLFAQMQIDETCDGLNDETRYSILLRMLVDGTNTAYRLSERTLMNILGTRVQMGLVSYSLGTWLVEKGYAHLLSFRPKSTGYAIKMKNKIFYEEIAHICYQPDPVCAHLAMCLMDRQWKYDAISGYDPKFWTEAATELFSSGVCRPRKGDVGEVATALFLLFCGDVLRQRIDSKYMHFSIDLTNYAEQLLQSCNVGSELRVPSMVSTSTVKYTVNFIQVVIQHFQVPLKFLCSHETLEWMYNAACAIYLPMYEGVFDILASIKCTDKAKTFFIPFIVSVKSQPDFKSNEVQNELKRMKKEARKSGIKNGLCLLVLLDAKNNTLTNSTELDLNDVTTDLRKKIVCKAIAIQNDPFGVNKLVQTIHDGVNKELSEVYSSHGTVPYLPSSFWKHKPDRYSENEWQYGQGVSKPEYKQ